MADKKLNELTTASDGAYVYAEDASGNQIKISKADLASVVAEQMYNGVIYSLAEFNAAVKTGTYFYAGGNSDELGTDNFGVVNVFVAYLYITQVMFGPNMTWRMSADRGQSWGAWKTATIS